MIKTYTNRHEYAYFLYAIIKSFFKDAGIVPPDKASHNLEEDDEGEDEDVISCVFNDDDSLIISVKKGKYINGEGEYDFKVSENISDENERKYEKLGFIYDVLVKITGKTLPWGNLTGIRPTKLYLNKLSDLQIKEDGKVYPFSENVINDAKEYMKSRFRVSDKKGILASDIAVREQGIMESLHKGNGYSVYIGIPFCPSTCLYCSFTSYPIVKYRDIISDYLESIRKELDECAVLMKDYLLDTIYIGGGTPTSLSAEQLDELLSMVTEKLPTENLKEFTVEAGRPDSITPEKLLVMKKYPVNRISVNPQTMNDETLHTIGRAHNVKQFTDAFKMAREYGFDNINTDIILGLQGESEKDAEYTIEKIRELDPDSLTVHSLAVKRASRLKSEMIEKKINNSQTDFDFEKAMDKASEAAALMGMNPYYLYRQKDMGGNLENTGFAREGKYGLYNILMMEEVQSIYAIGAGTVSKRVYDDGSGLIERCDTSKDVKQYISRIDEMIDRKRKLFDNIK